MVITEVRIKLCEENNERLLAFCSVTFNNAFVVRDLKVIEGTKGIFVAIGSIIAVAVPKAKSRMTIAAAIPIASLIPVSGLESCWPT